MSILPNKFSSLPRSSTSFIFNLVTVFVFAFLLLLGKFYFPYILLVHLAAICVFICVVFLWCFECAKLKVCERESTALNIRSGALDHDRYCVKIAGLYSTFLVILFCYWINPFYSESKQALVFYGHFFSLIQILAPIIAVLSLFYFAYVDRRQKDPYDSYWHVGCLFLGRWRQIKWIFVREHARVWFIKGFFAPIMFGLLIEYIQALIKPGQLTSFADVCNYTLNVFYGMDVFFGFAGYVLTLRLTDTHIQSTDPRPIGWLVCLACYHPFYNMFGIGLLHYQSPMTWEQWLTAQPFLYYLFGVLIIGCTALYGLSTVAFGYRMSNLTYRGIITGGPYRWTKHPAYIGKVLSWWLISLPFLSLQGPKIALQQTLALLVITIIYYWRAKTEEEHLVNYPEYVQYAKWIDENGIFAPLKKIFPNLCFSLDRARQAKAVVWFKRNV